MSEEILPEKIERIKRERAREKQEAYQRGFTEGEKRAIGEFIKAIQKWLDDDIPEYEYLDDNIEYWIRKKIELGEVLK